MGRFNISALDHVAIGVADGSVSPAAPANLLASAILGFLGQFAREYFLGELGEAATAQSPAVRAIILRISLRRINSRTSTRAPSATAMPRFGEPGKRAIFMRSSIWRLQISLITVFLLGGRVPILAKKYKPDSRGNP